jgi:hypothetical protein
MAVRIAVAHDKARIEFFNRPWWWEATSGHVASRSAISEHAFMQLPNYLRVTDTTKEEQSCKP